MAQIKFEVTGLSEQPYVAVYDVSISDAVRIIRTYTEKFGPVMENPEAFDPQTGEGVRPTFRAKTPGEVLLQLVNDFMASIRRDVREFDARKAAEVAAEAVEAPSMTLVLNDGPLGL
jgi:hypothetical protein